MFASRRSISTWVLSTIAVAAFLSCGGDSSTGPSGGVSKVTVSPAKDSIALGASVTLSASALDGSGHPVSGAKIFWDTENSQIATVTASGVVTGVAVGEVRIAASSNGVNGFSTITVVPPSVASVRVTPPSAPVTVGGTVHLQAEPLDGGGNVLTGRTITWSSADESIAKVDNTGLVTGVAAGATTITATCEGKTGTSGIAVAAQVAASITVAPPSVSITVGQTSQLTPTVRDAANAIISGAPVSWSVDNGNIASVTGSGLVTGVAAGTATITATSGAAHTTVAVTISEPPPNAVLVSPSSVSLLVTQRQQFTANVTDARGHTIQGADVSWSSSNSAVAAVGSTGLVIAVLPGTATITATSGSVSGTATVTVTLVPVRRVTVTPDALSLFVGDTHQLVVGLQDSAGGTLSPTGHTVTWSSSSPGVASVTSGGLVTAAAPGPAVITAKVDAQTGTATVTVAQVPVATVIVTPSLDTLIVGAAVQLSAVTQDAGGNPLSGRSVAWVSSDESIALVSSSGRVVSQAPGSATITATSEGKVGASTIVVIPVPVATVTVAPATQTVIVGSATPAFTATTKDAGGHVLTGRAVAWSSSDDNIATIDPSTGIATGVAAGTVTITATSEGKTGTATLTVNPVPVATVTVAPSTQSVDVGATTPAFTATLKDADGNVLTGRTVTWSSSDDATATVDANGVATGVAPGTVTITAKSEGKSGTATLTVNPIAVGSVTVAPPTMSIVDGTVATTLFVATTRDAANHILTGRTIAWTSSNDAIATIDNQGRSTGQSPGTVTITATSEGKSGTASLTVTPAPVATVAVAPSTQSVVAGSTTPAFTATLTDAGGNVLTGRVVAWSSSDDGIAKINASGVATGVAPGTVTITATSEGKSGTASLTVTAVPVATVTVSPPMMSIDDGTTAAMPFTATTKDASNHVLTGRVITWESSNTAVATIDNTGRATGQSLGTVTITATSEGVSGTSTLTVTPGPVATVDVDPTTQSVVVGSSTPAFTATTKDASGNVITGRMVMWKSSDNGIAKIDPSGVATGIAPGTVTITATSDGKSGTATLEVDPVPAASVTVAPVAVNVATGATTQLTATVRDAANNVLTGRVVTWRSSDESVATVDDNGLVTGLATLLGAATITATSEGQSGVSIVTVLGLP